MSWQPWVTDVTVTGADGGRRGPGSANHCMHGRQAVIEEILDWRPYDYVTDRTVIETPHGALKFTHTIEFEPITEGTTVHIRYALPRARQQREHSAEVAAHYGDAVRSALPALIEQLEARNSAAE